MVTLIKELFFCLSPYFLSRILSPARPIHPLFTFHEDPFLMSNRKEKVIIIHGQLQKVIIIHRKASEYASVMQRSFGHVFTLTIIFSWGNNTHGLVNSMRHNSLRIISEEKQNTFKSSIKCYYSNFQLSWIENKILFSLCLGILFLTGMCMSQYSKKVLYFLLASSANLLWTPWGIGSVHLRIK